MKPQNKEIMIKVLNKLKEVFMIVLGIVAIWYLQDIRLKLFGVVLCLWGGLEWLECNKLNIIKDNKNERRRK